MRCTGQKEELDFAPIHIAGVIREVVQLLHSDEILHNIHVELDCQDGLPNVRGDRVQLQQVILNLFDERLRRYEGDAFAGTGKSWCGRTSMVPA